MEIGGRLRPNFLKQLMLEPSGERLLPFHKGLVSLGVTSITVAQDVNPVFANIEFTQQTSDCYIPFPTDTS